MKTEAHKSLMVLDEIQSQIEAIKKNVALYEEANFARRAEAIDDLEFNIIDRIEGLLHSLYQAEELTTLKQDAERLQRQLEEVDAQLFQRLRAEIQTGGCRGTVLMELIATYVGQSSPGSKPQDAPGYDSLDLFINGLLLTHTLPMATKEREPEMVYYQQTPARIIFELIAKANVTPQDVFYDVGSGLGHVPILVHLLSGATARGIEFEPAYCDYARVCAAELNLAGVEFIHGDAREAQYADGAVFFMYTPFEGRLLQSVLDKLRGEARRRRIRVFTYGPCTPTVARQPWIQGEGQYDNHLYKLGVFSSR